MNSKTDVDGGGGIAIPGDIRNSTVPEQPDLTSNLAILQAGGCDLMKSSLTAMGTHWWYSVSFFSFSIPKHQSSSPWERQSNRNRKRLL